MLWHIVATLEGRVHPELCAKLQAGAFLVPNICSAKEMPITSVTSISIRTYKIYIYN